MAGAAVVGLSGLGVTLMGVAYLLGDAIDFGRHVIPIVREEVAKRDAQLAEAAL